MVGKRWARESILVSVDPEESQVPRTEAGTPLASDLTFPSLSSSA